MKGVIVGAEGACGERRRVTVHPCKDGDKGVSQQDSADRPKGERA